VDELRPGERTSLLEPPRLGCEPAEVEGADGGAATPDPRELPPPELEVVVPPPPPDDEDPDDPELPEFRGIA
jgi:hypothetical protein